MAMYQFYLFTEPEQLKPPLRMQLKIMYVYTSGSGAARQRSEMWPKSGCGKQLQVMPEMENCCLDSTHSCFYYPQCTRAERITFVRKTRGTVQGNGVGSSTAYWVMKEDSGPAAEQGLGPVFDLMIKLNVRPAIISFEFVAYILWESGKRETIQSRIQDTSV